MVEYKQLPMENREDLQAILKRYDEGWEKDPDIPYNGTYGPDGSKILHLVKYTNEEKAELEASKLGSAPQNVVDVNILSVPILTVKDLENGAKNPYADLVAKGWKEIHRTSKEAILKLSDPRGVILSDKDLSLLLSGLSQIVEDPEVNELESRLIKALNAREVTPVESA